jgi:RimJ/RimL family protein N-acetyltransferase
MKADPTTPLALRNVAESDLPTLFEQQLDPTAIHMAAFTAKDPADRDAFMAHWRKILADDSIIKRTILLDGRVAGHVSKFARDGQPEVTYWIGKEYWGQGVATRALSEFLRELPMRPLHARVALDNIASMRVLEKCGFTISSYGKGFANARNAEIEEAVLILSE